jgi:L-lactate dehydrogenase complex protein LldF
VVLLDNGRTEMLADPVAREGLTCIRCGTCCNICPIYFKVGGHPYWTYPGAIGALWAAHVAGEPWVEELPHICSLCGACAEVCPVKNDLAHRITQMRTRPASRARFPLTERLGHKLISRVLSSPGLYRLAGRLLRLGWRWRGMAGVLPPVKGWTYSRELPEPPPQSFLGGRGKGGAA